MAELKNNFAPEKSRAVIIIEYILLAVCLSIIALRVTYTEPVAPHLAGRMTDMNDIFYSFSMSAFLILTFLVWAAACLFAEKFTYRFSAIEVPVVLLTTACITACFAASNKAAAVNGSVALLAGVFMTILLVQILDCPAKIKLVLTIIAALGVVCAYQAVEDFFFTNQMAIEKYQQNPQSVLQPMAIEAGSLQHMLFEHRLYSKGASCFFTNANSAGSFMLLSFFSALAVFCEKFKNRKRTHRSALSLAVTAAIAVFIAFGLVLTYSKGAILAAVAAFAVFLLYICFADQLKNHKKTILLTASLLVLAVISLLVCYGLKHHKLPGGNSMLVRGQYWSAAGKIFRDNPFCGIGAGNFSYFYTHHKEAAAIESVADPHNFLLSILTQLGPIGLLGFLGFVTIPLYNAAAGDASKKKLGAAQSVSRHYKTAALVSVPLILVALFLIRPALMAVQKAETLQEWISVFIYVFAMPAVIFVISFLLLSPYEKSARTQTSKAAVTAVFCSLVGVLLHNLIDFAIFEAAVFGAFCAVIACLTAATLNGRKTRNTFTIKMSVAVRGICLLVILSLTAALFLCRLLPLYKSKVKFSGTHQVAENLDFNRAHKLLDAAANTDKLSPAASALNARLYMKHFYASGASDMKLLGHAENCSLAAISRNPADFKNYERLLDIYTLFAAGSGKPQTANRWLQKAFRTAGAAISFYPASARIRLKAAKIAEQLNRNDAAVEYYKKTIQIEDQYRRQFRIMYPQAELTSRLGAEKYRFAKTRLQQLSPPDSEKP